MTDTATLLSRPFRWAMVGSQGRIGPHIRVKVAESSIRLLLGIFVTVAVVRQLGQESFGIYSYVWSAFAVVTPLASLGLETVLTRRFSVDTGSSTGLLVAALRLRLYGSAAASAVLLTWLRLVGATQEQFLIGCAGVVGLFALGSEIPLVLLQVRHGSRVVARLRLRAFAISALARLAVAVFAPTPVALAFAVVSEPVILLLSAIRPALRSSDGVRLKVSNPSEPTQQLLKLGVPYCVSGLAIALYMRVDLILLERWADAPQVGAYAVVTRLSEFGYFIPVAVGSAIAPALLSLYSLDREEALARVRQAAIALGLVGATGSALIFLLAPMLLKVGFGESYVASAPVLRIHGLSLAAVCVGVAREIWFVATGKGRVTLLTTLSGCALNVVLNVLLIPRHGALGAAVSTSCSQVFAVFIVPLLFRSGREFFGFSRHR
jgi:polysaccharide transporter, PST family